MNESETQAWRDGYREALEAVKAKLHGGQSILSLCGAAADVLKMQVPYPPAPIKWKVEFIHVPKSETPDE